MFSTQNSNPKFLISYFSMESIFSVRFEDEKDVVIVDIDKDHFSLFELSYYTKLVGYNIVCDFFYQDLISKTIVQVNTNAELLKVVSDLGNGVVVHFYIQHVCENLKVVEVMGPTGLICGSELAPANCVEREEATEAEINVADVEEEDGGRGESSSRRSAQTTQDNAATQCSQIRQHSSTTVGGQEPGPSNACRDRGRGRGRGTGTTIRVVKAAFSNAPSPTTYRRGSTGLKRSGGSAESSVSQKKPKNAGFGCYINPTTRTVINATLDKRRAKGKERKGKEFFYSGMRRIENIAGEV
ncbi:hypothetical protein RND71_019287 [Anisodus tanguticus]|uniref:Uncharacterized protein n=1 Tax=Anisodus tanguticus TaxID=243964 RepID=A0AAE1RYR7_9SOLA|nr:hypothetical protein RND71_019287 [Anisodus tanguticus]